MEYRLMFRSAFNHVQGKPAERGFVGFGFHIAAPQPAFFNTAFIAHTVCLCQVFARGPTMASATHDHHFVFAPVLGTAPGPLPVPVIGKPIPDKTENGISAHVSLSIQSRSRQARRARFPCIWFSCRRPSASWC